MRRILYALIIALTLLAPVTKLDIAKLSPVEAVAVYQANGEVILKTDEGDTGAGSDAERALENLKENAMSIIYLDTAKYLLIGDGAEKAAEQLKPYLSSRIKVGNYTGGSVKDEAKYLDIHDDSAKPKS